VKEQSTQVSRGSVVTVAIIEQDPASKRNQTSYRTALYIGLAIVVCGGLAFLWGSRKPQGTKMILDDEFNRRNKEWVDLTRSESDRSDSRDSENFDFQKELHRKISKLNSEQCKSIFDLHMLSEKTVKDIKYEEGAEKIDIRLNEPWVEGMKKKMMLKHANPLLKRLFPEFEKLTTLQIAVYLSGLSQYLGRKYKGAKSEGKETRFVSQQFSRMLFDVIVHDRTMRKYLAYRGLRSRMDNGEWGTIIHTFARASGDKPGTGWRWISDADNLCHRIVSCGQTGTWFTVYSAQTMKDTNGTGVNSLSAAAKKNINVELGKMERIFLAGLRG